MASGFLWVLTATAIVILISAIIIRRLGSSKPGNKALADSLPKPTMLSQSLASALPDIVILPQHDATFKQSMNSYWAKQETEVVPGCVIRPRNVEELCQAVTILKYEYDKQEKQVGQETSSGLFAIRGGGHSPVHGAASTSGGVMIDLSLFAKVKSSEDGSSVLIGGGAKWRDVSKILDDKGLAVTGGRNSNVGVGGLTLGGGFSFFSPRVGLVCSNIINYEVVLASGNVVNASATDNPDLWRALKGGSNNFGIVTSFTARSFPATKIWSGFLYMPSYQANKVLTAFHEFVGAADPSGSGIACDDHAAGPIACFTYIGDVGMQAVSVNLAYTKLPVNDGKWPACWKVSSFARLWRLWSTCKVRSLTSATDEMNTLNPPGRRQDLTATTVKNDPATLATAHAVYSDAIALIRRQKVKGIIWTLVLQPILPEWFRKGDPNPLGLDEGADDPLVMVSFTVNWLELKDDDFVKATTRHATERIEAFASANKTGHRYRYLNYCAQWQRPFEGYGKENLLFLRNVSQKYDPRWAVSEGMCGRI